jgi:hypothetical protein
VACRPFGPGAPPSPGHPARRRRRPADVPPCPERMGWRGAPAPRKESAVAHAVSGCVGKPYGFRACRQAVRRLVHAPSPTRCAAPNRAAVYGALAMPRQCTYFRVEAEANEQVLLKPTLYTPEIVCTLVLAKSRGVAVGPRVQDGIEPSRQPDHIRTDLGAAPGTRCHTSPTDRAHRRDGPVPLRRLPRHPSTRPMETSSPTE